MELMCDPLDPIFKLLCTVDGLKCVRHSLWCAHRIQHFSKPPQWNVTLITGDDVTGTCRENASSQFVCGILCTQGLSSSSFVSYGMWMRAV